MDIIQEEILNLRKSISNLNDWSDESLFSMVCLKYFFKNGSDISFTDVKKSFVDGRSDGGIDFLNKYEPDDYKSHLIIAQSKFVEQISNRQDIIDIFTKMKQTIDNFNNNNYAQYNSKLKKLLLNNLEDMEDNGEIVYTLFVNSNKIPDISTMEDEFSKIKELKDLNIRIYNKYSIEQRISKIKDGYSSVKEGKIEYFLEGGKIEYKHDEDSGIIVNISSNSLKKLYSKYKDEGLFEQNFRYFVPNKRIDDNIKKSLRDKRDRFWFLNNGIIIGCKDFDVSGYVIKLYEFSIINGCQTTTLIGEDKDKQQGEDFAIQCKIIKSNSKDNALLDDVAEASNSQKPISERDLKSNRIEQKRLKRELEKHEISLEIKRGEKKKKHFKNIKNEYLAQLFLSFNLQMPGTARSNKKKIFSDENLYKKIFMRDYNDNAIKNIKDLICLSEKYDEYVENRNLKDDFVGGDNEDQIVNNSKFFVVAIIGAMFAMKKNNFNIKNIDNIVGNDIGIYDIFKKDYTNNDFDDKLQSLFTTITNEILHAYENQTDNQSDNTNKSSSVANFLKTELKYKNSILKSFCTRILNIPMEKRKIEEYMTIFNY